MPRKILHVIHNFPPEFEGGTERYLAALVRRQLRAGYEVQVITGSDVRSEQDLAREDLGGVPVLRLFRRAEENYGVHFVHARLQRILVEQARAFAPDLIHLHHWFNLGDEILQHLPEIPAIGSFHDPYPGCPRIFMMRPDGFFCGSDLPVPLQRCVECTRPDDPRADLEQRILGRRQRFAAEISRMSRALVPSRFLGDLLVQAGLVERERVVVAPLGIEPLPEPSPHKNRDGPLRLVSLGNLSELKGTDLLVRAVAAMQDPGAVELHLFGRVQPEEKPALERLVADLPVVLRGPYQIQDLAAEAGDFDLAILPSRAHETYSLVVEEAVALGWPLVVSDRGALPERVAGFGRVVSVDTVEPLAELLEHLASHRDEIEEMRRRLPPHPFEIDDHEQRLRGIYEETLQEPVMGS